MADQLLDEIKNSILNMQTQMQSTYANLAGIKLIGESGDKKVKIIMTATYSFEDIEFDKDALLDDSGRISLKEFRWRIREAWKNLSEEIQKTTQSKTMELLQEMEIPEEIQNLSSNEDKDEQRNNGST